MNKVIIYSLFLIFLILAIPAILSFGIKLVPGSFQSSLDDHQKVYKDREISQVFTANKDWFSGIGVSIRNLNLMNKKDIKMTLYKEEIPIRVVVINGRIIQDGQMVKFIFEPIKSSGGQIYKVVFSAEDSSVDEALEIFLTKNFKGEPAVIGKEVYQERLSEVLFYRPSNRIYLMIDIYDKWFGKLTADLPFFIFYCLILSLALGYLLKNALHFKKIN